MPLNSQLISAKSSAIDNDKKPEIIKVAPLNKEALLRNIQWVLQEGIDGVKTISDSQCDTLDYTSGRGYLIANTNGLKYYILNRKMNIDGKIYNPSICYTNHFKGSYKIECITRSDKALISLDEDSHLVFYMEYNQASINKCPSRGSVFN